MKGIVIVSLLSSSLLSAAYAVDNTKNVTHQNNCGRLHIEIANLTASTCALTNKNVIHGREIYWPPATIKPGTSKYFDMDQLYFGPNVTLTYQCDKTSVTFNTQQNYCFMEAGDITGTVQNISSSGIRVDYAANPGSYFWSTPGNIIWRIQA